MSKLFLSLGLTGRIQGLKFYTSFSNMPNNGTVPNNPTRGLIPLFSLTEPELRHRQLSTCLFQRLFSDFVGEEVGRVHHRHEQHHKRDGNVRVLETDLCGCAS